MKDLLQSWWWDIGFAIPASVLLTTLFRWMKGGRMSGIPDEQASLREPAKSETRVGWWFMRTFRSGEVARRTARNDVIAAAWRVHFHAHTAGARADDLKQLSDALNAYAELQ